MFFIANQNSVLNGGRTREAETHAHQNSGFNIMLCLAHQVNERIRAIQEGPRRKVILDLGVDSSVLVHVC